MNEQKGEVFFNINTVGGGLHKFVSIGVYFKCQQQQHVLFFFYLYSIFLLSLNEKYI